MEKVSELAFITTITFFLMMRISTFFHKFLCLSVTNVWRVDDKKTFKNGRNVRAPSPLTHQSLGASPGYLQNRPGRGVSQHPSSNGSPLVSQKLILF